MLLVYTFNGQWQSAMIIMYSKIIMIIQSQSIRLNQIKRFKTNQNDKIRIDSALTNVLFHDLIQCIHEIFHDSEK